MRKGRRFLRERKERRLVLYARKQLGKPYKYGAKDYRAPREFDCSSFIQYCYRRIGIALPRISIEQAKVGKRIPTKRSSLKIGDVIFRRGMRGRYDRQFPQGVGHALLYVGNGKVIHAEGVRWRRVIEEPVARVFAKGDITIIRRYF
jgi:cell wall-associated NlpC family hydrolase